MQTFLRLPLPPFLFLSSQYLHLMQSSLRQFSHFLHAMARLQVLNWIFE